MKSLLSLFILFTSSAFAESKGTLQLRAQVPLTAKASINQYNVSANVALLVLSSQVNSDVLQESQKVEVEGMNQAGLQAHIKKIVSDDRTIQYHLLINRLKSTATSEKPIFLKISAN